MLSRRDEAEGGCGRAECVSPAKLTVTHRGSCVAVVRKVTPSKISVVLRLFLFHTLQISGTLSDKAEHFAKCRFTPAPGKSGRVLLALHCIEMRDMWSSPSDPVDIGGSTKHSMLCCSTLLSASLTFTCAFYFTLTRAL